MSAHMSDVFGVSHLIYLFILSLIPLTLKVLRGNREPSTVTTSLIGFGATIGAALLLCGIFVSLRDKGVFALFSGCILVDGLSASVGTLVLLIAGFCIFLMRENPATKDEQFAEITFLVLSSTFGMLILISAADLLTLFVGLEVMSLPLYMLIGISHEQKLSKESAMKYFILGGFSSAIFLYGVSFIYGSIGTTEISQIIAQAPTFLEHNKMFLLGLTLVILGFCFKVSIFPFHAWVPDVYQGSPTPLTALMATGVKAASFAAFIRIMLAKPLALDDSFFDLLQWLAVLTMFVGNVAAIVQTNLKRVLAYSSIAHSGYLMVGLVTLGYGDHTTEPVTAVVVYLISYSIMTLGTLALVSHLEQRENSIIHHDNLIGLSKRQPMLALGMSILLLSLAGIPPTFGFFGKFYLFQAALGEGLVWLVVWGVLNSAVAAYYYLRPVVYMYMKDADVSASTTFVVETPFLGNRNASRVIVLATSVIMLLFGIFSGGLYDLIFRVLNY